MLDNFGKLKRLIKVTVEYCMRQSQVQFDCYVYNYSLIEWK